jgi:phage/plasmid-associated DNA primase
MEVKSNDHGTWRRIRAVPFKSLFTENPVEGDKDKPYQFKIDKKLENKFDTWKNVFASMLVDIVYKTEGHVKDCDIVMSKSNEYRKGQDYISEYISERVMQCEDGRIKKAELNNDFATWYAGNYGGKGPSPKELHEYINKEFGRIHNQVWKGIRIRYETEDDEEDEDISLDDDIRSDEL